MGLTLALKAHEQGNLTEASKHYKRALEQGVVDSRLFQNYGALLKAEGNVSAAKDVYLRGLEHFPSQTSILRNYANLLREKQPILSLEIYFQILQLQSSDPHFVRGDKSKSDLYIDTFLDILDILIDQNLNEWALRLIKIFLSTFKEVSPVILKHLFVLLSANDTSVHVDESTFKLIEKLAYELIDFCPLDKSVSLDFALASYYLDRREMVKAKTLYEQGLKKIHDNLSRADLNLQEKLQHLVDCNSWNFACIALPLKDFSKGWKLFDHGLRTPAQGAQRWQRALIKPFEASVLPLWRGQEVANARILLLEEQAIGDTMMFISLVPKLLSEFKFIGLFVSNRLKAIYERSFSNEIMESRLQVYTRANISDGSLKANNFDFQLPIGSICQHRFLDINNYAPKVPALVAESTMTARLREEYINIGEKPDLLVGISWKGGVRGKRIAQKSIIPNEFFELLIPHKNIRFIDLQYGDTKSQIEDWANSGLNVVHDARINPLKNMDLWLSQVNACDAVLSVANTTSWLWWFKYTYFVFVECFSDWRWLIDPEVTQSYWYPSVGIARAQSDSDWSEAFAKASSWLSDGCPSLFSS